jgi:hypothetical protein
MGATTLITRVADLRAVLEGLPDELPVLCARNPADGELRINVGDTYVRNQPVAGLLVRTHNCEGA